MNNILSPLEYDPPKGASGIADAHRLLVAEISTLRRAKRSIEAQLEKAEAARDLLRQMMSVNSNASESSTISLSETKSTKRKRGFYAGSQTSEVITRSKQILLQAGVPLQRNDLLSRIEASGFMLNASNPSRFVGRTLWQSDDFIHIPNKGYWLRGEDIQVQEA
ncbi:hypothetical protein [Agrobacterium rosae]|uniref:Uncharacterized protein n=1 Tax=Agrobacterium rosae TaxID=1972867 RepID=A0A1R3TIH8_9HYPH|nr:hypothetical protein [Agrobacterium rosae]SCX03782.1 hypothetical protein DSM25559_0349 [Agrobacterium rosae]